MGPLNKSVRFTTRYTTEQALRIQRAAVVESQRRGERVTESDIVREGSLNYADGILEGYHRRSNDLRGDRRTGDHSPAPRAA